MKALCVGLLLFHSPAWAQADLNRSFTSRTVEQSANTAAKLPALSNKFEILDKAIELGNHDQGETVTGSIKFKGDRPSIEAVRAAGLPGFQIRSIDWTDNNGGAIRFSIDTSLMTETISRTIVFQPVNSLFGVPDPVKPDSATISIQIKGKVRIVQLAQSEVAAREGMVEIEIQNVGNMRFRVENVLAPGEPSITFLDEETIVPMLGPGESAILPLYFRDTRVSKDPELMFKFTPGVFANNAMYIRLDLSKTQLRSIR